MTTKEKNIHYTSTAIGEYYRTHRRRWDELYPSEQWVFERIGAAGSLGHLLDVGCACGGLGEALDEKWRIASYTGVDINREAIEWAKENSTLTVPVSFQAGDILSMDLGRSYDLVVSLSCADWNIETEAIIRRCWDATADGGHFVISLRLTDGKGVNDMARSYQYINFEGRQSGEVANYVVFNFSDLLRLLGTLEPALIGAYGYWGPPSATAVTPFSRLLFAVFYLRRARGTGGDETVRTEFHLPLDIFVPETGGEPVQKEI